jgi:cyclic beta-1,2-glucan synthetase
MRTEEHSFTVHASGALAEAVEDHAWDGAWYRRGYFDDGAPLGSKECTEARIDSIAQSWAAISGAAEGDRVEKALLSWTNSSFRAAEQMILLFTPAL